jgi:hypothetical protein
MNKFLDILISFERAIFSRIIIFKIISFKT